MAEVPAAVRAAIDESVNRIPDQRWKLVSSSFDAVTRTLSVELTHPASSGAGLDFRIAAGEEESGLPFELQTLTEVVICAGAPAIEHSEVVREIRAIFRSLDCSRAMRQAICRFAASHSLLSQSESEWLIDVGSAPFGSESEVGRLEQVPPDGPESGE